LVVNSTNNQENFWHLSHHQLHPGSALIFTLKHFFPLKLYCLEGEYQCWPKAPETPSDLLRVCSDLIFWCSSFLVHDIVIVLTAARSCHGFDQ
jgi:hypothetical protein